MFLELNKTITRLGLHTIAFLVLCNQSAEAFRWTVLKPSTSAVDGWFPTDNGVVIGNQFFGVTVQGGAGEKGVLYKVNLDGTGFVKLRDFAASEGTTSYGTRSSPVSVGNTVFGTLFGGTDSPEGILSAEISSG